MLNRLLASKKNPYIPGRNSKETFNLDLSGAKFSISLPPNSIWDAPEHLPKSSNINIYDESQYDPLSNLKDYQKGMFPPFPFLKRTFGLWGPIYRFKNIAMVSCTSTIHRLSGAPDSFSCLNPTEFEQAVLRNIYFTDGPGGCIQNKMLAPCDWNILKLNGTQWITFETHKDFASWGYEPSPISRAQYYSSYYSPVDDNHFIALYFQALGYLPAGMSKLCIDKFILEVSKSVELRLTNDCERKVNYFSDKGYKYSKSRNPENWKYHEFRDGDEELGEDYRVIRLHGTPPPDFKQAENVSA